MTFQPGQRVKDKSGLTGTVRSRHPTAEKAMVRWDNGDCGSIAVKFLEPLEPIMTEQWTPRVGEWAMVRLKDRSSGSANYFSVVSARHSEELHVSALHPLPTPTPDPLAAAVVEAAQEQAAAGKASDDYPRYERAILRTNRAVDALLAARKPVDPMVTMEAAIGRLYAYTQAVGPLNAANHDALQTVLADLRAALAAVKGAGR